MTTLTFYAMLKTVKAVCMYKLSPVYYLNESVAPHCSTRDPGGGVGSRSEGWSWVG